MDEKMNESITDDEQLLKDLAGLEEFAKQGLVPVDPDLIYEKNITDVVKLEDEVKKIFHPETGEVLYFKLQKSGKHFLLRLADVLLCLKFAEKEGEIPELPDEWWNKMKDTYTELQNDSADLTEEEFYDEELGEQWLNRITIDLNKSTMDHFRRMALTLDVPLHTLIKLYLSYGAKEKLKLNFS